MTVAEWAGTLVDWKAELEALKQHIAPALVRAETRQSAGAFIDGLHLDVCARFWSKYVW